MQHGQNLRTILCILFSQEVGEAVASQADFIWQVYVDRARFRSPPKPRVTSKRHWPDARLLWQKNSEKQPFLPLGELSWPFFGFVFCFSLQCPRQRFWPLEEHLTTETSYRWVLVASSALGPLLCLILLRARDSAVILALFPLLQRWGAYSSFSPRKPALYSSQGEQVQS